MGDNHGGGAPPKRASGGARATAKRRAEKAAAEARRVGGEDARAIDWLEQVGALGKPPADAASAHTWLARAAVLIVHATLHDVAVAPEQMRRDAMRQIEQASKVLDPAKLSEQLASLERSLEELSHARAVSPRSDWTAPASATVS